MHECVPYVKLPQRGCIPSSADGSTSAASAVPPAARMGGMGASRLEERANFTNSHPSFLGSRIFFPSGDEAKEDGGGVRWKREPTSCGWA
ncbi:MAG: hypothetical protein ACPIOQ_80420 [Promethearchaeia archaeon]